MSWEELGHLVVGRPLTIVALVLLGLVVRFVSHRVIDRVVRRAEDGVLPDRMSHLSGSDPSRRVQRARTTGSLLKSIVSGLVVAVVGTMILSEFVDIAPIIASAGVLGVALGFGAQSLVKDYFTGFFLLFEDQIRTGDVVKIAGIGGLVEDLTLRHVRLRDYDGNVHFVPNGQIAAVVNMSRGHAQAVIDVGVAYREDLDRVMQVMREVAERLRDVEPRAEAPERAVLPNSNVSRRRQ